MWERERRGGDGRIQRQRERGSALLLLPTGVLVVVVLGALALDAAVIFAAQRQLADVAAAAANDVATAGLDTGRYYRCGELVLDARRVQALTAASVRRRGGTTPRLRSVEVGGDADGRPTVTISVTETVERVFVRRVPGIASSIEVAATAVAVAQTDGRTGTSISDCGGSY